MLIVMHIQLYILLSDFHWTSSRDSNNLPCNVDHTVQKDEEILIENVS